MKKMIIIIYITFTITQVYGQSQDSLYIKNEISISINQTNVKDNNTENKIGFGFGGAFLFMSEKRINLLLGIEYNRTNQLKKYLYISHGSSLINTTYHINSILIPLTARINFFKKTKMFIETGVYFEANFNKTISGFYENYGTSIGIGLKIPILKHEYIIKTDYKYGFLGFDPGLDENFYTRYYRLIIGIKI